MRSKVLWILLAVSLLLNVFFVAGLLWPGLMGHPPRDGGDPVAAAAEDFSLDDRQVAALEALRQRVAERRNESRGDRDSFRTIIIDSLRPETFDRAGLAQSLDQRREGMGDMILDMSEDLHAFLAGLSPDQKAAFLDRAERDRDFLRRLLFPRPRGERGPRE